MRRTTTLAALLLGATLLVPASPANPAAGETCRGEAATIVGSGPDVQGTEGRDVIVSGSAGHIRAHGGDDLICVVASGTFSAVIVDAGPGDDLVDATAHSSTGVHNGVRAVLGQGTDTYYGGASNDVITANAEEEGSLLPDTERDVIHSGDGSDLIRSHSGTAPNPDVIAAGPGDDSVWFDGPMHADGQLDGGTGRDELRVSSVSNGTVAVDAAMGTVRLNDVDWMRWSGIERLALRLERVKLSYTGTDDQDSLEVSTYRGTSTVQADGGAGDDDVTLVSYDGLFSRLALEAGAGHDAVVLIGSSAVRADLGRRTLRWGNRGHLLSGVEDMSVFGRSVRLIGDDARNVLVGGPCLVRASGGRGRDVISLENILPEDPPPVNCSEASAVFDGGRGPDTLEGSAGKDKLRGGGGNDKIVGRQGRDLAVGGPGRDRCKTEIRKTCER